MNFLNMIDRQAEIDAHVAEAAGRAARSIAQGAHITKSDLKDELHGLENEAGLLAAFGFTIVVGVVGAIVWGKVR